MRVLVTFAMDAEFAPWRKLRKFRSIDYDGLQLWKSSIEGTEVTALLTGMGGNAAAQAMDLMMRMADRRESFDVCISSGLAGALLEELVPGDIIAPQRIISERSSADLLVEELAVDPELHKRAVEIGAICSNCLFSADRVLVKASQKKDCSSRAQSVDMESFEIIKDANAWGTRAVVLRAISDSASDDLPVNFNLTISANNRISIRKVILQLAKNPLVLPALIRFARQSRNAAKRLSIFLDRYIQHIPKPTVALTLVSREAAAR